jgi:hypothetical protein
MAAALSIAGVIRPTLLPSWSVAATANGRDTLTCEVPSDDASYRPALDDEILLFEGFGTSTSSLLIAFGAQSATVEAGLPMVAGDRIRIYSTANADDWLETAVTTYSGTTLTFNADKKNGSGTRASWVVARRIFGGTIMVPEEHGAGSHPLTAITTRIEANDFNALVDRRYITASIPIGTLKAALQVVEPYLTTYGVSLDPAQVDGPTLPALEYSRAKAADVMTELATLSGYLWEIDYDKILRMRQPGSVSAPFNLAAGDGNTAGDVTVTPTRRAAGTIYANRVIVMAGTPEVPITAQADDAGEQAAHGLWEVAISAPTIFDQTLAQALADAYLLQRTPTPKLVTYGTLRSGLAVGQTQTINLPRRNVNNSFILTDVRRQSWGAQKIKSFVTALEGSVYQPGWRNLYQQWLQPLTTVTLVPGTAGAGRQAFFFGGSSTMYVDSGSPFDWVPLDGIVTDPGLQVALDTVARGSTSFLVTARLRATAGTVQCRLRNVSDGATVGTSAVVNSATWQTVTFVCTLTAGSKIYRAELLGSQDSTAIAGICYGE